MDRINRLTQCSTYASVHVIEVSKPNKKPQPTAIMLQEVSMFAVGADAGEPKFDSVEPMMVYDNYLDLCKEDDSYRGMVPRSASDMTVRRYLEYNTALSRKLIASLPILRDPETTKAYQDYAHLQADMDIINQHYLDLYDETDEPAITKIKPKQVK